MGYRINYQKVVSQAREMSEDAKNLGTQLNAISQMEQDVRNCWKGQAADAFLAKLSALKEELTRTKQQMANLADTVKYCADRIQREDEETERRANALKNSAY